MFIKKRDYNYLEGLYNSLDEGGKKMFLELLLEAGSKKADRDIEKIKIIDDDLFAQREDYKNEIITRTMIKKAYRLAKEKKS